MALLFICNGHTAQTQNIIHEMGEWLIYGSNGNQKATVKKLEYSGEFMGETSVTCDIYSPSPISFSIGDYLVYRGERFTIDYDATRLKQARNNTYGKGYTYENMRFLSYVGELKKCEFLDFVPSDNLIHFSQLPDFSFYAETVKDLADRLQANLDRIYTGSKAWSVQVVQGFEGKENINVSVSKATCFDALRMAYDQFEATFIIRGRTITIGTAGNELETDFKYGKGNGLKTIERSVDESDSLVTRLRAYGNTTNLPANYYKNIGMRVYAPIYEIYHVSTTGCDIHFVPKLKNACFSDKNGQYSYWVTVSLDETLWLKAVASPNNHLSSTAYSVVTVGLYGSNTQAQVTQFLNQLQSGTYDKLYFKEGINVGAWPVEYREYAENVPNLMAIDRLMLPGFPELTTDPYIDASNISTLGVREKSVYFDGSDPDTPDIHPTLEGMTAAELRAAGYTIDLDAGDNGNLDEIAADATETDGSPITADGAFEGVDEVPGFKVSIKDIGFDINDYLSTETATLVMKTGMCGGREFTIVKVEKVGNKYVLECQRTEDVSHYFPYNPYLIKAGDKFVLTNIEMPKAYIDAASQRLLAAAQAYIAKYSAPQWVYAIKMDDIWMQRQRDNSVSEASSYYWNIKEGDVMNVTDSDLGVDISEVIDRLTIREGYGPIPEFEVVLRKEKPQGTIGVLQNRIRQLELRNAEQVDIIRRQQNYLTFIFGDTLADVMSQLDKKAETWYQANDPSSAWTTDEVKSEHVGDLWMDTSANGGKKTYIYRYTPGENPEYHWDEQFVPDEVFDEIDGKAEIFVQKPTSYNERDMWIIENGISSSDLPAGCVAGDIVISSTDSTSFNKAHWSKKDRYTDDSSLNAFISGTYADNLQNIQTQIDGKAETWYQSTDPSTAWTTTALKNQHKGDIWHNSSTSTINGVKAGQDAIWNGTAWDVDETVPQAVYDEIDGKCAIYVTWGAWGNDLQEKDLFIPAANTTQGGVTYKANKVYRCVDKDTPTFQEIAYTDDTQYNGFITKLIGSSGQTKDAAENAIAAIKHALSDGNTYNEGGLILSNLISLGTGSPTSGTFTPWAGISGIYKTSETGTGYKGHGIAAWFGGGMIDKEVSAVDNAAKSLFRFDGSGYVASGNLSWDKNGNVTIQGYSINATTLQVGGANVATQAMLDNFVSKAFFNRLFTAYDANGNAIVPNNTTTAINNLKIMVGTWTEQYLSALGLNSEGGGGGTGDVSHIKIGTNPDVFLDPDEDGIIDMSSYAANWNDAYNKRHTHSNKSVLDGITSTKVSHWDAVYGVVPSAAYESGNQLADKNFVNSSISTSTATFRGTNTTATTESAFLTWANGLTHDLNDYVFWSTKDSAGNTIYKRYKYDGSQWVFEYDLNNSSFTSDQWSAINSGITSTHVSKLNGIASGAQVNVIESVKVNGSALSISSKAVDITAVPLTIITGADDLKAIEGLSGTSGFLKKTAANTWALDTTVVLSTRKVSTGNGLQGGGDLSADRTISILLPANSGLSVASTGLKLDIVNNLTTASDYRAISATQAKKIWDLLNQMFTLEGAGTTASPYVIKANYGLYSEQFLSALGQNSQGGGGGTTDLNAVWGSFTTNQDEYANEKIDAHHIPIGNTLEIVSGTGLIQQKSGIVTPDVYTKVTVDTYGRVTQGGDLIEGDIPSLSWSKITSGKPTTLSGYGIANAYTKAETDSAITTQLGSYVTLGTAQTITGAKTFNDGKWIIASNESNGNSTISTKHWDGSTLYNNANTSVLSTSTAIRNAIRFRWYDSYWNIGNIRSGNTATYGFGIALEDTTNNRLIDCLRVTQSGTFIQGQVALHEGNYTTYTYSKAQADSKYVTALGVNGNNLTWTKNGTTSNITIPYATKALYDADGINLGAYYYHSTDSIPANNTTLDGNVLHRFSIDNRRRNDFFWTISALAGRKNYFYCAHLNPNFQVTSSGFSSVNSLFNHNISDNALISASVSASDPAIITIEYSGSQYLCFTDTTFLMFVGHQGNNVGYLKDYKVEILVVGASTNSPFYNSPGWHTVVQRSGVQDELNGLILPIHLQSGYSSIKGLRLTINSVQKNVTWTEGFPISKIMLVDVRPAFTAAQGLNALDVSGGDIYGAVKMHSSLGVTGNTSIGGTLVVTSNTTIGGTLGVMGNTTLANSTVSITSGNTTNPVLNITRVSATVDYVSIYVSASHRPLVLQYGTGNVGINVNAPTAKLDVAGTFNVTSAATLGSTLSVADTLTLSGNTSAKKRIYFGDSSHYLELDANGYFHFSHGLYSDSFVSALGANSQGGGGSTFDEEQMWQALGSDPVSDKKIDNSHLNIAAWAKAANKPSYAWSEITNKPTWIGTSKPTYTFSEIGSTPTTLAGYGIIDAWSTSVSRTKNTVLAAPSNANGTASFRALVAADIPSLTISKISDISDASVKEAKHIARTASLPVATYPTVGEMKAALVSLFNQQGLGIGDNVTFTDQLITKWNDDSATLSNSGVYTMTKIGGGYNSSQYGQWLLSYFGSYSIGVIGRNTSGGVSSWTPIKWLAWTDGTNASGTWGIGITGNAGSATKLQTPRTIWGQSFDGTANVNGAFRAKKDLGGNLADWVQKQHDGVFEVGRATNTMCVAIGVTDDNWGYIQTKGNSITTPGNLAINPGGGTVYINSNVGIGASSPSYKLHINGTLGVSGAASLGSTLSVAGLLSANGNVKTTKLYLYKPNSDDTNAVYLTYDSTNSGVHIVGAGLYSDSYVSALGANSQGGGGSTFDEEQMWEALDATNEVINASHIPNLSWAKITNRPTTLSGYGILDAYTKTQADAKYVTELGVDGNNITWTKNGSVNSITVPYAYKAHRLINNTEMTYGWNGINYFNLSASNQSAAKVNDTPFSSSTWTHILRFNHANNSGYYTDLAVPFNANGIYYKRIAAGSLQNSTTNGGWVSVLDQLNYTDFTVTKTGSGASGTWGISISGSAAKLGTATVGSNTKPIYLSNGTPTAVTVDFVKNGDVLQTTNPFSPLQPRTIYISKIDNAFYAAEKRFTVTGETIRDGSPSTIATSSIHNLFDGSYETTLQINNGDTAVIHIRFDGYSYSAFPGYPYGYIYVSFYHNAKPTSVTARCYNTYEPHGVGWHDMTVVDYSKTNQYLYRLRNDLYRIEEFEITVVGDTTNPSGHTSITQIEMCLDRPAPERTPYLSKYAAEKLYYPLTIESSLNVTEGVVLNNNKAIFFKDASGAGRNSLYFDANNNLALGYGTAGAGYNTYIDGNYVTLRYGSNHATGLVLASDGNVRIPNTLSVDGTITNKYLAIAESWTDTWSDGTHTHPWYGIDGRWNDTGVYSTTISDYYGMTLKTSAGNISMKRNGNVGIGTTDPSYKLHVNGYTSTTRLYLSSSVYLEYDSTNGGVHLVGAGLYSDSFISALGANDQGGGSSGFDEEQMWKALNSSYDDNHLEIIDDAHLPNLDASKITSGTFNASRIPTLPISKISGLQTALDGYLPLSGGTMSGNITMGKNSIVFNQSHDASWNVNNGAGLRILNTVGESAEGAFSNYAVALSVAGFYKFQIAAGASGTSDSTDFRMRYASGNWYSLLNSGNYTSYTYSSTASRTKNQVLAAPSSANGAATFRALVADDIPDLSSTYATAARATTLEGYFTSGAANNVVTTVDTTNTLYVVGVTSSATTTLKRDTSITIKGGALSAASISTTGNVSISGTLGVTGAATFGGSLYMGNNKSIVYTDTNGENVNGLLFGGDNSVQLGYGTNAKQYYTYVNGYVVALRYGANSTAGLWLNSSGNVGIGTTSPSKKLDVNGTLNASGAVTFGSTLGVTGATTLTGLLTANGNIKTGTSNGAYIQIGAIKLVYDSTNNALKVIKSDDSSANFYATGAVSALGANSSGGGSGTFDEDSMWAALGTTSAAQVIASSHIPNLSWNKITSNKPTTLSGYGITDAFTQTQSFNRFYSLYDGKAIEASSSSTVDLDTMTDVGSYYCQTNTASGYVTNKPANRDIAFRMWVSAPTGTTAGYRRQRFQYYDQVAVYERIDTNLNSVSWGSWYKVQDSLANYASTSSLDNYLPLSGGQMTGTLTWKNSTSLPEQTSPDILLSIDRFADGGTTKWVNAANVTVGNATTATKLSTVSKTAWGQTYWTSGGVPTNISGAMTGVGNITMDGYLYMANQNRIYFKSSGNTDMIAMYQTAANHLYIGYGFASEGYSTYIAGNTVELRYGTSRTTGLTLDGGDVTVKGKVCVGTGGANSYLASDAADNIYLRNSSGAVLVCDSKVVRRSTSLSDVTLGSSSYPWGGLYSTTGSFSSTLTVSGTSTFNAYTYRANTVYDCWYDSNGDAVAIHSLSSANNYWVGYGLCPKGYELRIGGGSIRFYYGTSRTAGMLFNDSGYLGVGNTNPSQRLHVTGNILASGEITGSSDERKKNIISNTKFNVRDIASARSIIYEWNDDRDKDNEKKIHGGSIAQDWLGKADSFLSQDNDGFYSINYGALALCSAITIAREVLKHEDRITKLERENAYLKNRVNELERRIA